MSVKFFWQPQSFNLDQIGQKRLVDISDGDTSISCCNALRNTAPNTASSLALSADPGMRARRCAPNAAPQALLRSSVVRSVSREPAVSACESPGLS